MGLRIYLASRYDNKGSLRLWRDTLKDIGCEVVSDWLDDPTPDERGGPKWPRIAKDAAVSCQESLYKADILIADFTVDMDGAGGSVYTEIGMAYGIEIPIWLVGDGAYRNIFAYHPGIQRFQTFEDVVRRLVDGGAD